MLLTGMLLAVHTFMPNRLAFEAHFSIAFLAGNALRAANDLVHGATFACLVKTPAKVRFVREVVQELEMIISTKRSG
jgi:hypothetical protein